MEWRDNEGKFILCCGKYYNTRDGNGAQGISNIGYMDGERVDNRRFCRGGGSGIDGTNNKYDNGLRSQQLHQSQDRVGGG